MERKKSNNPVKKHSKPYDLEFTGSLIDMLFLDEDRENVLLELDEHVRDMTPEYVRKENLFY
jgi:hypothetical protein